MTSDSGDKNKIDLVGNDFLLDDIEDLPSFVALPSGAYVVTLDKGFEEKEINDEPYFELAVTVQTVEELNEKLPEGESSPKPGDIGSFLFNRTNKFGMGNFKEIAKPIAQHFGSSTVGEVIDASKGLTVIIIVKRTKGKDKNGNERYNSNLKKLEVI